MSKRTTRTLVAVVLLWPMLALTFAVNALAQDDEDQSSAQSFDLTFEKDGVETTIRVIHDRT